MLYIFRSVCILHCILCLVKVKSIEPSYSGVPHSQKTIRINILHSFFVSLVIMKGLDHLCVCFFKSFFSFSFVSPFWKQVIWVFTFLVNDWSLHLRTSLTYQAMCSLFVKPCQAVHSQFSDEGSLLSACQTGHMCLGSMDKKISCF